MREERPVLFSLIAAQDLRPFEDTVQDVKDQEPRTEERNGD
jgi:hypothetical protein